VPYKEESNRRVSDKILGLMGCFDVRGKGVCGWAALSLSPSKHFLILFFRLRKEMEV
jgi:hypothetical protein